MKYNQLLIYVAIFLILIIIICIGVYYRRPSFEMVYPEGYYFKIKDENDVESCIHNSGILPSSHTKGERITLSFLKKEINEGKELTISKPQIIYLGEHPKSLNQHITSFDYDKDDLCHRATFSL